MKNILRLTGQQVIDGHPELNITRLAYADSTGATIINPDDVVRNVVRFGRTLRDYQQRPHARGLGFVLAYNGTEKPHPLLVFRYDRAIRPGHLKNEDFVDPETGIPYSCAALRIQTHENREHILTAYNRTESFE